MNILYADDRPYAIRYELDEITEIMKLAPDGGGHNCRNCGAPVEPLQVCAYCGTRWFARKEVMPCVGSNSVDPAVYAGRLSE